MHLQNTEKQCAFRSEVRYKTKSVHSVRYGIEFASYIGLKIWNNILRENKESSSLNKSKARIDLLKVNNRDTRTRSEICSKLTIKIPDGCHWCRSGVFIFILKLI